MKARNFIAWEGPSRFDGAPIVVIVTGITKPSENEKTGPMWQVFILHQDVAPLEAIATGADQAICGDCPLRGVLGQERACYVNVGQSPTSVWRAYQRGVYPRIAAEDARALGWFEGEFVRLGAYGDPGMAPIEVMQALVADAAAHTGYTHAIEHVPASEQDAWASMLMISATTPQEYERAQARGWVSFYAVPEGAPIPADSMLCASERQGKHKRQCIECLVCSGTGRKGGAVSVHIDPHGSGAKYVTQQYEEALA